MQVVDRWSAYGPSDLPPRDAWLINPEREKLVTPTDDRGLILVDQLITDVKATVDPTYTWPGDTEVHHFYWYGWLYQNLDHLPAEENPSVFRNLACHKGRMPKIFEAWLHLITLPVPVPSLEVRRNRVQSWWAARNLWHAAQKSLSGDALALSRRQDVARNPDRIRKAFCGRDIIGEAYIQEVLERNFNRFESHRRQNEAIPPEFRMVTADEPRAVITELGKVVSGKYLNLVPAIKAAV